MPEAPDPQLDQAHSAAARERLSAWSDELRQIAEHPDLPLAGTLALDLLIDALERLGSHGAAWEVIGACNEADRRLCAQPRPGDQQRGAYLNTVAALAPFMKSERGAAWRENRPDDGLPVPAPLVGLPRSGPTMERGTFRGNWFRANSKVGCSSIDRTRGRASNARPVRAGVEPDPDDPGRADDGVSRWRRYEGHPAPVLPTSGSFVSAFGYEAGS